MATSIEQLIELLAANDDFASLSNDILVELAQRLQIQNVKGGSQVVAEGTQSEYMFILASGRLRVSREDSDGGLLLYNEVLPGDCVGETGMVLDQQRTANIFAMRDSTLAILYKQDYFSLIKKYPIEFNKVFSLAIYRQLRHQRRVSERRRAQSYFFISLHPSVNGLNIVQHVQSELAKFGTTKVISSSDIKSLLSIEATKSHLDQEESHNDHLIYLSGWDDLVISKQLFHLADQVVFLADATMTSEITHLEQVLSQEIGYSLIRKHLVLIHPETASQCVSRTVWQKARDVERVYPLKENNMQDYARLIRFLLGKAVGLVLGGGGARGFAHLGVLKAFEQHNIPIDVIGGNSMGALIGACYASGIPLTDIHHQILKHSKDGMKLNFPLISLMSNKGLIRAFKQGLGEIDIENMWSHYFAAACNLTKAETTVLDTGPLWRAVLASNSPAGLFSPVVNKGELLVDGAILENVPVQSMRVRLSTALERRRGNGKVIAVDVDLKEDLRVPETTSALSNWNKVKSHLNSNDQPLPGIFDILLQVAHIGGLHKRQNTKFLSDYYLEPPLRHFSLMDYKKAEAIIKAGYDYTLRQISEWDFDAKSL